MNKWVIGIIVVAVIVLGYLLLGGYSGDNRQTSASDQENLSANDEPVNENSTSASDQENLSANDEPVNENRVDISGFVFSPASLTIKVGETVYWTNKDSAPHTVTSSSGNELNSETLEKNEEYSHTFDTTGTYNYYCTFHPGMKGIIIVE